MGNNHSSTDDRVKTIMYKFVLCKYLYLRSMETTKNWFSLNADKYQILGVSSRWVAACPQAWMFAVKKERDDRCVSLHRQNLCGKNSPPLGSDPLTTVCESQKHEQGRVEGTHQCAIQTSPVAASSLRVTEDTSWFPSPKCGYHTHAPLNYTVGRHFGVTKRQRERECSFPRGSDKGMHETGVRHLWQ